MERSSLSGDGNDSTAHCSLVRNFSRSLCYFSDKREIHFFLSTLPCYLFWSKLIISCLHHSAFGTVCKKELRLTECLLYGKQGAKLSTHLPTTLVFQMRKRSCRLGNWFTLMEFLSQSQDGHRAELGRVRSPERVPPSSAAHDLLPPLQSHYSFA